MSKNNKLKRYQIDLIVEELTNKGLIIKDIKDE
jgi:hypothetical protein